ncbi:MAG: tRNA 2-thiouridine(34) synthase MnmA [Acidimicrobiia bacterium]
MTPVVVMMSGGVDSSVAAALLLEQGYAVLGATLKLWGGESDSGCCSISDVEDARRVAAQLGVPHYVFNLTEEFNDAVVNPYVDAYANGVTPNPCVSCNRYVKFGAFLRHADALGVTTVATGHHARIDRTADIARLQRGRDEAKDQSYVLSVMSAEALARTLLPVGDLTKAEVRDHAARLGLRTASKAESMDVCFITKGGREAFLERRFTPTPGTIQSTSGEVLGHHEGIHAFTIGQRRGTGIAVGERAYVVDVDAPSATVTLGTKADLARSSVTLSELVFTDARPAPDEVLEVQTRAHGAPMTGRFDGIAVHFTSPQPRVAPGQIVALYRRDICIGSGVAQ